MLEALEQAIETGEPAFERLCGTLAAIMPTVYTFQTVFGLIDDAYEEVARGMAYLQHIGLI